MNQVGLCQVGLFVSGSLFAGLCIDETALCNLHGLDFLAKNKKNNKKKQISFWSIVAMWISGFMTICGLLLPMIMNNNNNNNSSQQMTINNNNDEFIALSSTTSAPLLLSSIYETANKSFADIGGAFFALNGLALHFAFIGNTLCALIFALHAEKSASHMWIAACYIGSVGVVTSWLDTQLMPLVAFFDAAALIDLFIGSEWRTASSLDSDDGGKKNGNGADYNDDNSNNNSNNSLFQKQQNVVEEDHADDLFNPGATAYSAMKGFALSLVLAFATMLEAASPAGSQTERLLQPLWSWLLHVGSPYLNNSLLPVSIGVFSFVLICIYFSYLDLTRSPTKLQKDYWPSVDDMWVAAKPQLVVYAFGQVMTWVLWYYFRDHYTLSYFPDEAPTIFQVVWQLSFCLLVGDFFIYCEHFMMHKIPFFRNHIHNVHHDYSACFSWAGGWVHPVEDLVAVGCQVIPVMLLWPMHPLIVWTFTFLWVVFLVDEHSGHDVCWSPYVWLPFTNCPCGGGGAPHDIHHYKPTKNYGFVFVIWDRLFGTFEAVGVPSNPYVPPFIKELKKDKEKREEQEESLGKRKVQKDECLMA